MQSRLGMERPMACRLLIIVCLGLLISPKHLSAFWLTDGSLFQQPETSLLADERLLAPSATQSSASIKAPATVDYNAQVPVVSNVKNEANADDVNLPAATRSSVDFNQNPWIQVADGSKQSSREPSQKQQEQEKRAGDNFVTNSGPTLPASVNAAAACQCNPEWLQNQTSLWLGRWLNSSNFFHQMRANMLTFANAPQAKLSQQQQQARSIANGSGERSGLAWNRQQTASKRSGNSAGSNHNGAQGRLSQHHHHHQHQPNSQPPDSSGGGGGGRGFVSKRPTRVTNNAQNRTSTNSDGNLQPSIQTNRGQNERGPKGDQGPRGERGPSGLILVKDRNALFDLDSPMQKAPASAGQEKQRQLATEEKKEKGPEAVTAANYQPRLVFVDTEQMLVLETISGWRPIPMMAALHDFRKTIPKFSLSEQSSQTIEGQGELEPSPNVVTKTGRVSLVRDFNVTAPISSGSGELLSKPSNSMAKAIQEALGRIGTDLNMHRNDDEDADDDDNDDDENDNDDDDDDDDDEDDDDFEEEDDDGEEDEDENAIGRPNKIYKGNKIGSLAKVATGGDKTKRRRAQVTSRSALAAASRGTSTQQEADDRQPIERTNFVRTNNIPTGPVRGDQYEIGLANEARSMKLRLIALNEPFSGNQRGLRGANFECKRNAAQSGIRGAFQALLATSYQNLNEIVRHNSHVQKYPIVNMRGEILAASWQDLFRAPARATNPLSRIYSFDGRHVASSPNWPNKLVWLGTGSKIGARDSTGHNCDGWHSDSLGKLGFASPLHSPPRGHHGGNNNHHHHHHHQNNNRQDYQQRDSILTIGKFRTQKRRFAGSAGNSDDSSPLKNETTNSNSSSNMVFDFLEKYPCRMPLVVLCIETIAQGP